MTSEKWKQAKQLYDAALRMEPDERSPFLLENCGGDEELRIEVESLLECSEEVESFLEKPAVGEMAEAILAQRSLAGQKILQYNVIELIGAGGMGEVYLAEDTRLKRRIALKILPSSLSENKRFVQRFEREACAASALNHPNILTVHEIGEKDGINFIASELVKGETLRERLNSGKGLELSETLSIVLQVAAALRAAHESDIIHRDIKPENIMVRDDGLVKVLDFGLAKLTGSNKTVDSDEETVMNTVPGMIMGTAAYMSPEQARGRETDARTDIWSVGVVLYEMLTGSLPFAGETASDTMASILMAEPPPIGPQIPAELTGILKKALQKDAGDRYQKVKDLILDLETFRHTPDYATLPVEGEKKTSRDTKTILDPPALKTGPLFMADRWSSRLKVVVACGLLIVSAGAVAIWMFVPLNRNPPSPNILASLRARQLITWDAEAGEDDVGARFSPTGTMIAYALTKNGQSNIWTRQVPDGKPNRVTDGDWDYSNPIWSPDGQRIAFISNRDNQLAIWTMPFSGGEMTFIEPTESINAYLIKWSANGEKIYLQEGDSESGLNIFAVELDSKEVNRITTFNSADQAQFFSISPQEDRIAYSSGTSDSLHIFVSPIGGGTPVQVTNDDQASDEYPFWLPDGKRIIYSSQRDGIFQTCVAYLDQGRTEQINLDISDTLISDVAPDGSRILFQQSREESNLWKVGTDGKNETRITADADLELWPDISPDGRSIVFQATSESKHLLQGSLLIKSIDDDQQINIAANGFSPRFSPDGRKIAFLRDTGKLTDLWITGRNGTGERQLTTGGIWFPGYTEVPYNRTQVKDFRWSPDGSSIVFCAKKDGLWNVWQIDTEGSGPARQISDNRDENIRLYSPAFSTDGKQVAWTSLPGKTSDETDNTSVLYLWDGKKIEERYRSDSIIKLIGWSENNLLIAVPQEKSTAKPVNVLLKTILAADGRKKDIASVVTVYFNNIQLSSDGQKIALTTREDGKDNIRVIYVTGGENAKITANVDPTTYISGIAWSPDGKSVYFSKQKVVGTISMIENFK